jgi:hypothetical protein
VKALLTRIVLAQTFACGTGIGLSFDGVWTCYTDIKGAITLDRIGGSGVFAITIVMVIRAYGEVIGTLYTAVFAAMSFCCTVFAAANRAIGDTIIGTFYTKPILAVALVVLLLTKCRRAIFGALDTEIIGSTEGFVFV